ncbi:MAG: response regulator [Thermoguttaceae bacterium]
MTSILVVDDSAVDRRLVGGMLQQDSEMDVEFAVHGADAITQMEAALPDLVVTDLMMPEMDGLELVTAVRAQYPLVPVILITSKGSEEVAVEALQRGAASYVPKRSLAKDLFQTVRRVLAVSGHRRGHWRLMGCMTKSHSAFVLENDSTLFSPLVSHLQEEISRLDLCDETERTRIGVALEEALTNALYHGNLGVDSDLREENDEAYCSLVERRRREEPYRNRRIHVEAVLSRDEVSVMIRDEGSGFDPASLPDPTDPVNLDKVSGRGVLLMRTFMDEVIYSDSGEAVTLVKRRNADADSSNDKGV